MDIQSLLYFQAAAKTLNYTQAAEQCYVTRQALRQSIQQLESELKLTLFENNKNHLSLTLAGQVLLEQSQQVIKQMNKLKKTMTELAKESRILKMAVCNSMIPFQFTVKDKEIKKFEEENLVSLEISYLSLDECIDSLKKHEVDCAYIFQLDDEESEYNKYPIYMASVYCDYGEKIDFDKKALTIDDLLTHRFLGMGKIENTYPSLYRELNKRGLSLNYEICPDTIETFYRVTKEKCIILDLEIEGRGVSANIRALPVEGYKWFVGLLADKQNNQDELFVNLANFLQQHYPKPNHN